MGSLLFIIMQMARLQLKADAYLVPGQQSRREFSDGRGECENWRNILDVADNYHHLHSGHVSGVLARLGVRVLKGVERRGRRKLIERSVWRWGIWIRTLGSAVATLIDSAFNFASAMVSPVQSTPHPQVNFKCFNADFD